MNSRDRRGATRPSKDEVSDANTPAALCEAGLRHLRAGRPLDAQVCCEKALAADAGHADALHLMGLLSLHAEQYDLAVEWIARALRQDPKAAYLTSLGTTLLQQGRRDDALKAFDKAVQLAPDNPELWRDLGNALVALERPGEAIASYQQALRLNPYFHDAACQMGLVLRGLGRMEEALTCFNLCDVLQPNHAPTLTQRAITLRHLKRFDDALADYQQVHALDPANADICNNIGVSLQALGQDEEALPWFDRTLKLRPESVEALGNKAVALGNTHRFGDAFATYERVLALDPNRAMAQWNRALLQLLTGDFAAGWAGREARWRAYQIAYPTFPEPPWLGEQDIAGKTILVGSDEGLGDTIQFARYVPMLAERGARVILVVAEPVHALLSGLAGVSQCLAKPVLSLPPFDLHCPISSLPLAFGTRLDTIPSKTAYLAAPAPARVQAWDERLPPRDRLRIGLAWSGSPNHKNDRNRSIPLQALARLLDLDATFVSLQKDPRADDQAILRARPDIVDLTADLTDFSDTAALVSCLDLVITVDTAVAHLAGALGCPTWILLPYTPDYRWLLGRDDSPWYPSVRLFRQTATRDYDGVIDRVRTELLARMAATQP